MSKDFNRGAMIDGILAREGKALPDNEPPDEKWKAMFGVARLNLGVAGDVLRCLIDRGGNCYPGEEFIARWTGIPIGTVKRHIKKIKDRKLVKVIDRRRENKSNIYIINWPPIFAAYDKIKAFEAEWKRTAKQRRTTSQKCAVVDGASQPASQPSQPASPNQKCDVVPANHGAEVDCAHVAEVRHKPSKGNLRRFNLRYEVVTAPSETATDDDQETKNASSKNLGLSQAEWKAKRLRDQQERERLDTFYAKQKLMEAANREDVDGTEN